MTADARQHVEAYVASLSFRPDRFQTDALDAVASGKSVVVTAPTGAGKTLIAEGAIAMNFAVGKRSFYTTPIKALSNQKFADLTDAYGQSAVGLLTGDNVINGDASIVVMTTEVLRNMIYENSPALTDLGIVILDEVHYLADRSRGSIWEEVIIHLDSSVPIVCLSATIANPEEFTDWVTSRRGETDLVIETERPVPLTSMYMWRDRHANGAADMLPVFAKNGRTNPAVSKLIGRSKGRFRRFSTPRRTQVVEYLYGEGLLPVIYFVFSRKGCDATAQQIASSHLALTTADDRRRIRAVIDRHVAHLGDDDLTVLGFERWRSWLERGVASHHAGLIPAFKETVEELFLDGLVQVVAATETLALGINMPAKTVVLESLSKFNGDTHELLRPSDYTQLTGRAGRRGIDTDGTAVVLYSSYVPFDRVSGIAAAGSNPLRSSFSPSYNMSVNLIARYDDVTAHRLLSASFANFADTYRIDTLETNLAGVRADLATFREAAACDKGDVFDLSQHLAPGRTRSIDTKLLDPGVVLDVGGWTGVLLGRSWGGSQPSLVIGDARGRKRTVKARDLPKDTMLLGTIGLPQPIRASDPTYRREVADHLETFIPEDKAVPLFIPVSDGGPAGCTDIDDHLRWVERAHRAERDIRRLERRITRTGRNDIAAEFDRLRSVLNTKRYTNGWALTGRGEKLRRLYNELDLLLAESLIGGHLDGLDPPEFAAIVSIFTYETRGGDAPQMPHTAFSSEPIDEILASWESLAELEESVGLTPTRPPDVGLVDTIHGWASGLDLDNIFDSEDVRAGDFVRSTRQLLDLLRQIREGFPDYRMVAGSAIALLDRGIVAVDLSR
ncbi:MAG: DEAD/DEAH box helicase [Actinomycetia bacterium]|nr:DEAD/DEAH box helicase [Actinomycetes bacterium]